jgi:hypothetical protein
MTPIMNLDSARFQSALKAYILSSSRTLADVVNSRMFFLLIRTYMHLGPKSPKNSKKEVRQRMEELYESNGKSSKRIYLWANKLVKQKGKTRKENAEALRLAVIKVRRSQLGGIGYLRSVVQRGIRKFIGKKSNSKPGSKPKAASDDNSLFSQYKVVQKESAVFGQNRTKARAMSKLARDGINPVAEVQLVCESETRLRSGLSGAFTKAMSDALLGETIEMETRLKEKMIDLAMKDLAPNGFKVG